MAAGEREPICFAKEVVKWVLAPGVRAAEDILSDSEDDEPRGRPASRSRGGRKWDADEDSEVCAASSYSLFAACPAGRMAYHV